MLRILAPAKPACAPCQHCCSGMQHASKGTPTQLFRGLENF